MRTLAILRISTAKVIFFPRLDFQQNLTFCYSQGAFSFSQRHSDHATLQSLTLQRHFHDIANQIAADRCRAAGRDWLSKHNLDDRCVIDSFADARSCGPIAGTWDQQHRRIDAGTSATHGFVFAARQLWHIVYLWHATGQHVRAHSNAAAGHADGGKSNGCWSDEPDARNSSNDGLCPHGRHRCQPSGLGRTGWHGSTNPRDTATTRPRSGASIGRHASQRPNRQRKSTWLRTAAKSTESGYDSAADSLRAAGTATGEHSNASSPVVEFNVRQFARCGSRHDQFSGGTDHANCQPPQRHCVANNRALSDSGVSSSANAGHR